MSPFAPVPVCSVLMLRMLKLGGHCAVIVPDGVTFGSSKAHKALRQMLVEENQLEAIIKLPSGVFKPYAGVSTAILLFTKEGEEAKGHAMSDLIRAVESS